MRSRGAPSGPNITHHVTLLDYVTFRHCELRHVQVHRFEALTVVDAHRSSVQGPVAHDLHDTAIHGADRGPGRRPLIEAAVEIPGRFAIHITLHAEKRGHAATYWQRQRRSEERRVGKECRSRWAP